MAATQKLFRYGSSPVICITLIHLTECEIVDKLCVLAGCTVFSNSLSSFFIIKTHVTNKEQKECILFIYLFCFEAFRFQGRLILHTGCFPVLTRLSRPDCNMTRMNYWLTICMYIPFGSTRWYSSRSTLWLKLCLVDPTGQKKIRSTRPDHPAKSQ